jgi:AcrR family transcriptional regulator
MENVLSPQRRSRRGERKEETRQELIAAAATVFARRGFHGASLDQIAQEAGYTSGAIYWHFDNKDLLFLAVIEKFVEMRAGEFALVAHESDLDLPARAKVLADQWMARFATDPEFVVLWLEFVVHAWRNPEMREAVAKASTVMRNSVSDFIDAQARHHKLDLPLPAAQLGLVFRELGVGIAIAKLVSPDAISDETFGEFVQAYFENVPRRK